MRAQHGLDSTRHRLCFHTSPSMYRMTFLLVDAESATITNSITHPGTPPGKKINIGGETSYFDYTPSVIIAGNQKRCIITDPVKTSIGPPCTSLESYTALNNPSTIFLREPQYASCKVGVLSSSLFNASGSTRKGVMGSATRNCYAKPEQR